MFKGRALFSALSALSIRPQLIKTKPKLLLFPGGCQRRQWHPTTVLLPGKSHGWRSLEGCSPWGCRGSDTTEQLHFHFSLSCIGEGNGNPLQCSCLENPRGRASWWAAVYGVTESRTRLKRLGSSSSGYIGRQNPGPGAKITYIFPSGPSLWAFEPRVVKFLVASHQTASCFPMQGEVGGHKDHNTVEMMHRHRGKAINGRKQ